MKILKVYVENSVVGGYFDEEFEEPTKLLFDEFHKRNYKPVISTHVMAELEQGAPDYVINNLNTIDYEIHQITDEMYELAQKYLDDNIVSEKYRGDALHIAIATVIGVDVLVSWNFKHIVNLNKIKLFNSINFRERYNMLEIRTPREVLNNE